MFRKKCYVASRTRTHKLFTRIHTHTHTYTHTHTHTQTHTQTHTHTHSHTYEKMQPNKMNPPYCNTLQHTVTHCNTLHHTASHCKTLHNTAPHCNTLQNTATRTLQQPAKTLPNNRYSPYCPTRTKHFNTLQHAATTCKNAAK